MAENSALIYYYHILEALKIKVNFESDQDSYYNPYEIGRIRLRNLDNLAERIKRARYFKKHQIKNHCHIFTLNKTFSPEEIAELKTAEENRREKTKAILKINFSDPTLYYFLIVASKELHKNCGAKLDKLSSQQNGARIVNLIDGIILKYYQKSQTKTKPGKDFWEEILADTNQIIYEINLLTETGLWGAKTSLDNSTNILRIKSRIEGHL
ncbi:hypothetical protein IKF03_02615 [Candidatus Saccharibacteria bacterium]|nr:hypothetical protein [Candidatus Saccharibacteria bacterium]